MSIKINLSTTIFCLIFLLIGFSGYQISQAQTTNVLSLPPIQLCSVIRDLKFGTIGADVKELQKYLNNNGSPLAQTGFGSSGNETNYFGFLTKQALTNFQVKNKLNATGIFDSATRDFLSCEKENNLVPKVETPKQGNNQSTTQSEDNKYSISGSITGISDVVTLHNNNNDIITIKPGDSANFVFPKKIINGSAYNVTVETDNLNQKCYLKNNIGTINNANVDNIGVACGLGLSYNPFTMVFGGGGGSSAVINTYTVAFDGNTSDGGSTATQTLDYNTPTALTANGYTKTGYTFSGWNTVANGSGTAYADTASYTIGTANVTLYAQWTINTYTVAFDGNTSDGGSTATQTLDYNTPTALTANGYTKTGYTFSGWNTVANGSGTAYADTASYTIGTANVTLYAQWTMDCGASDVTFTYNGDSVTYGVVGNNTTGECWLDRNLGATRVALSSTDSQAYGDLFQWGRPADGHQLINRTTGLPVNGTQTPAVANVAPGTNTFIIPSADWSSIDANGATRSANWGVSGSSNSCPTGFRVPTETELNAERTSWSSNNPAGAFASPLKLPVPGYRSGSNGSLGGVGSYGFYWSSTVNSAMSRILYFGSGSG